MITDQLKTKFCNDVMHITKNKDCGYIEAVIELSEQYGFGPEVGAKLLNKQMLI